MSRRPTPIATVSGTIDAAEDSDETQHQQQLSGSKREHDDSQEQQHQYRLAVSPTSLSGRPRKLIRVVGSGSDVTSASPVSEIEAAEHKGLQQAKVQHGNEKTEEHDGTHAQHPHTHVIDLKRTHSESSTSQQSISAASSAFSTPLHSHPPSAIGSPTLWSPLATSHHSSANRMVPVASASVTPHAAAASAVASSPTTTAGPSIVLDVPSSVDIVMANSSSPPSTTNSPHASPTLASTSTTDSFHLQRPPLHINTSSASSPAHSPSRITTSLRPLNLPTGPSPQHSPTSRPLSLNTLSPRCPAHLSLSTNLISPGGAHFGSGSSVSVASGSPRVSPSRSPARSPCRSPWMKPSFVSKLSVSIPDAPLISSPVAHGFTPRPSQLQREKESSNAAASGQPVTQPDGVVSSSDYFSISLLKGRRRHMEDSFIQAAIDLVSTSSSVDNNNTAPPAVEASTDVVPNFFGIADGHGKNGAQVSQLAGQILPAILQQKLRAPHEVPFLALPATSISQSQQQQQQQKKKSIETTAVSTSLQAIDTSVAAPAHSSSSSSAGISLEEIPPLSSDPIARALEEAYLELDAQVIKGEYTGGSTCTTALIHQLSPTETNPQGLSQIHVAHVGDSRCVLSRSGEAVALTSDHKPDRADERARVEKAGGQVLYVSRGWRVDGILNISRAIGDTHLKDVNHPTCGKIVARPEMSIHTIQDEDEFIILASDGIWSKISNQQAVEIVRAVLMGKEEPASAESTSAEPMNIETTEKPASSLTIEEGNEEEGEGGEIPLHANLAQQVSYVVHEESSKGGFIIPTNPVATPRPLLSAETMVSRPPPLASATTREVSDDSRPSYERITSVETIQSITTPHALAHHLTRPDSDKAKDEMQHMPSPLLTSRHSSTTNTPFISPSAHTAVSTNSSTHLTGPIAALQMKSIPIATAASSSELPSAMQVSDEEVKFDAPCCWSSLQLHPERIERASEALIQHAFTVGSNDNISVCIVLLYPFQQQQQTDHVHHAAEVH